jgi:RNA polymerase sigma-70 factor, ECF subfamily
MEPGPDDEAIVERLWVLRAQMGARDAYARIVDRYDARLLFYLRRLLGVHADAEDVRQEVWLTVVRKLNTLEDPGAFRAWLYRVARHRGISWLRKRRGEVPLDEVGSLEEAAPAGGSEEDEGFSPAQAAAMYAALDGLSPSHREILTLRFLGGLSYDEIAAVVDCPVGTVRSRIHYAKTALRTALGRAETAPRGEPTRREDP